MNIKNIIGKNKASITIKIYSITGSIMRELVADKIISENTYTALWYGNDNRENYLNSGLYFVNIQINNFNKTEKFFWFR